MTSSLPRLNFVQATQADLPQSDYPPVSVRDLRTGGPDSLRVHGGGYYNAANSFVMLGAADQEPSITPPVSVAALGRPLHGGGYYNAANSFVMLGAADQEPSTTPPVNVAALGRPLHGGGYYNAANSFVMLGAADQEPSTTPPVNVAALGRPLHGGGYYNAANSYCNIAPEHRDVAWCERTPATTAAALPPPQQAVAGHTSTWHVKRRAPNGYKILKKSRSWAFWRCW